jgi:oxaloacetate decarboxylase beta subunit
MNILLSLTDNLQTFWGFTGFANVETGHLIMILIGLLFIFLAIKFEFEPLLLIPIGFGILIGNIPFNEAANLKVGIYEEGSVLNILYQGVLQGWYPPLIFLGIGAMTDFSALIANPKLILIGAACQFGIFGAYIIALNSGFEPNQAGAIGIIGGADGPTAIFLSSKLAPNLMGAIAISAYSYMALVPIIQPPFMRLLTTKKERVIRMKVPRVVSQTEKILFPIVGLLLTAFIVPSGLPLLGMLFFGNMLKESGVTRRLAETARGPMIDIVTILLGLTVGASTKLYFFDGQSIKVFAIGALSFVIATIAGILFVKIFFFFRRQQNKSAYWKCRCFSHPIRLPSRILLSTILPLSIDSCQGTNFRCHRTIAGIFFFFFYFFFFFFFFFLFFFLYIFFFFFFFFFFFYFLLFYFFFFFFFFLNIYYARIFILNLNNTTICNLPSYLILFI